MSTSSEDQSKRFYDLVAKQPIIRFYFRYGMDGILTRRQARKMLAAGEFRESDSVVDVGSGFGGFLIELSKRLPFKNKLVGVELSEGLVEYSKKRLDKEGIKNIKIVNGSAIDFSSLVDEATVINSGFVIKYLDEDELNMFLKEALKVLKPGGQLFISEFAPESRFKKLAAKGMHARKLRTTAELDQVLKAAGFTDIKHNNYSSYWIPITLASLRATKPT